MPSDQDTTPTGRTEPSAAAQPAQAVDQALAEVEHTLEQMLALAQLSASDLDVDRNALQKTLERLQHRIDRIADSV